MPPDLKSAAGKDNHVEEQDSESLPVHVEVVKDGLLDFNHFLGLEATMLLLADDGTTHAGEDIIPLSAYKADGRKGSQRAREKEFLESALELAKGARKLEDGFAPQSEWRKLFQDILVNLMSSLDPFG